MAFEQRQFGRTAELIIGPKFTGSNGLVQPPVSKIFRTRISFKILKGDDSNPNKAKISIDNLNEDSNAFIEKYNNVLMLLVVYGGSLEVLFFGDLAKNGVHTKRVGPDIITTLEAGDAEKVLKETHIEIGLAPGATNVQILAMAAAKLKLTQGVQLGFTLNSFVNGVSFSGKVKDLIDQLTEQVKVKWSIQNGEFQILPEKITEPGRVLLLAPDTGLLGIPTKTKTGFEFESLINTSIKPGKKVQIVSKVTVDFFVATVKVKTCEFDGDTNDGNCQVKVEGIIL